MRINDKQFITNADRNDKTSGTKKTDVKRTGNGQQAQNTQSATDSVKLSTTARDIAEITLQLKESSEVRKDVVNELKQKIKDGTYQVSGRDIAGKIISKAKNNIF